MSSPPFQKVPGTDLTNTSAVLSARSAHCPGEPAPDNRRFLTCRQRKASWVHMDAAILAMDYSPGAVLVASIAADRFKAIQRNKLNTDYSLVFDSRCAKPVIRIEPRLSDPSTTCSWVESLGLLRIGRAQTDLKGPMYISLKDHSKRNYSETRVFCSCCGSVSA